LKSKFGIGGSGGGYTIQASAGAGGSISPAGAVAVTSGASQAFSIVPNPGYSVGDLTINGVAVGVAGSYEFSNVLANHTIEASFLAGSAIAAWRAEHFTAAEIGAGLAADDADPDGDGSDNLTEFAFNGDPRSGASQGLSFHRLADGADGDASAESTLTIAVRRGAVFAAGVNNAQVAAAVDGLVYRIEGNAGLAGAWNSVISHHGFSDTPPAGSGLPDLTGADWHYHTFSAFNGLPGKGFVRAVVVAP
jgi:hypothetical protein